MIIASPEGFLRGIFNETKKQSFVQSLSNLFFSILNCPAIMWAGIKSS